MYQTDKFKHGLIPMYDQLLSPFVDKQLKVLEIGVYLGGSIQYYGELLPKSQIIGIDVDPPTLKLPNNAVFEQVDQTKPVQLRALIDKHGPFHVVIDDGAHTKQAIETSLNILWPVTNLIYVIEDWGVGYLGTHGDVGGLVSSLIKDNPLNANDIELVWNKDRSWLILKK